MKNLTIKDIGREAGVSHTVVSAVINRKENRRVFVSEEKRRRILEIVQKHGFIPRKTARDLVNRKTNAIGVVLSRLSPYYSTVLEALNIHAFALGLQIVTFITEGRADGEEKCFNIMRDGRVDGAIISAGQIYQKFAAPPYNFKMVTLIPPSDIHIPSVSFDDDEVGRLAADHLISAGCRRLCCFGGDVGFGRFNAFVRRARNRGFAVTTVGGPGCTGFFADATRLLDRLFALKPLPDGVFAFNDPVGLALLTEAQRRGFKIPDDIAVMGCDNTEVCSYAYPSLTSVDISISLSTRTAIEKLTRIIDGKRTGRLHSIVPVSLVKRESTKRRQKK